MRTVLNAAMLVLWLSVLAVAQQDPLPVVASGWQPAMVKGKAADTPGVVPARAVTNDNKYFQRKQRDEQPQSSVDPNEMTIDGRSAALERAEQEARRPKTPDTTGFTYSAEVRNDSGKKIEVVFWEYRFTEIANPTNVSRRQFVCAANMKDKAQKTLSAFSQLGPSDVIAAESLARANSPLFDEKVIVNRIEFADGDILQRNNWKFEDVKKSVERATATPWGTEVCRAL